MVIYNKMQELIKLYNEGPDNATVINTFIADNIHPEPYLTADLVSSCIESQKKRSHLKLGAIKEEDKLIACVLVAAYLQLDIYADWVKETVNNDPANIVPVITRYLLPKYVGIIDPLCENKVDFEQELIEYNPRIYMGLGHNDWRITLSYGETIDSTFAVENLDKETLKVIKAKAENIYMFSKKFDNYIEDRKAFLDRVYHYLGDDDYQRRGNAIYLDRANNIHRKYLAVETGVYQGGSVVHDLNITMITLSIKVFNNRELMATICDKKIDFDKYDDLNAVNFFDLDEAFNKIKIVVDSGYKRVEFMD